MMSVRANGGNGFDKYEKMKINYPGSLGYPLDFF